MRIEEVIERALEKLVLPIDDRLVGVKVMELKGFRITYLINEKITYEDGYKIAEETRKILKLIIPHSPHVSVDYELVKD